MAVTCSNCGEELLGSVNRCWRCGREMVSVAGAGGTPPVRRAPVSPEAVPADMTGETGGATDSQRPADTAAQQHDAVAGEEASSAGTSAAVEPASSGDPAKRNKDVRVGSPFAAPSDQEDGKEDLSTSGGAVEDEKPTMARLGQHKKAAPIEPSRTTASPGPSRPVSTIHSPYLVKPPYHERSIAIAGSIGSVLLGLMSFAAAFVTVGAAVTAVIGVGMGIWGLYSSRRGFAILGLMLCCIALLLSGFQGAVDIYTQINGTSPFETPPDVIE